MFTQDNIFEMDASAIKLGVYITIKKHNARHLYYMSAPSWKQKLQSQLCFQMTATLANILNIRYFIRERFYP